MEYLLGVRRGRTFELGCSIALATDEYPLVWVISAIWRCPERGGTPSHHPFLCGIFPQQKPTTYWDTPMTTMETHTQDVGKEGKEVQVLLSYGFGGLGGSVKKEEH